MIPTFPVFKILELSDKAEVEHTTRQFPPYSDYQFTQMWIWDLHEPTRLSKLNDNLVIIHSDAITGESHCSFLGTNAIDNTVKSLFEFLGDGGHEKVIRWIPEEVVSKLTSFAYSVVEDRDNHDYVLAISQLFGAKGKHYKNFRRLVRKIENGHSHLVIRTLDLSDRMIQTRIEKLILTWKCSLKPENKVGDALFYHRALDKLLLYANEFESVSSLGIFDGDELIAFVILDIIDNDYALSPFLIANREYTGSFQYIQKMAIESLHNDGVKYLNFEPDFGIPSWRTYKMAYNPLSFLKKYTIETRN